MSHNRGRPPKWGNGTAAGIHPLTADIALGLSGDSRIEFTRWSRSEILELMKSVGGIAELSGLDRRTVLRKKWSPSWDKTLLDVLEHCAASGRPLVRFRTSETYESVLARQVQVCKEGGFEPFSKEGFKATFPITLELVWKRTMGWSNRAFAAVKFCSEHAAMTNERHATGRLNKRGRARVRSFGERFGGRNAAEIDSDEIDALLRALEGTPRKSSKIIYRRVTLRQLAENLKLTPDATRDWLRRLPTDQRATIRGLMKGSQPTVPVNATMLP